MDMSAGRDRLLILVTAGSISLYSSSRIPGWDTHHFLISYSYSVTNQIPAPIAERNLSNHVFIQKFRQFRLSAADEVGYSVLVGRKSK